ncbi:hypothetical protein B0H11DRAFT_1076327 [Mycena galericulata]|nr:hypothetical protein B0H11DRAFT_1076327 [Mycena galericulata]
MRLAVPPTAVWRYAYMVWTCACSSYSKCAMLTGISGAAEVTTSAPRNSSCPVRRFLTRSRPRAAPPRHLRLQQAHPDDIPYLPHRSASPLPLSYHMLVSPPRLSSLTPRTSASSPHILHGARVEVVREVFLLAAVTVARARRGRGYDAEVVNRDSDAIRGRDGSRR